MTNVVNTQSKRADALDALRGYAILTMILSGSIPFGNSLPAWMYHAQVPPPDHVFNPNIPGITWVDLVFPFFLFAMGAAFPFALNKKIEQRIPLWKIIFQIVQRGLLLAGFAIFIQHVKPYALNPDPTDLDWLIGIAGFLILTLIFTRFSFVHKKGIAIGLKIVGYLSAIVLMYFVTYPNGSGFSLNRSDIIILVLANVAVGGSFIWLFTQKNHLLRLGLLGFLIAFRLTQNIEGSWNQWLWNFSPFPWLYKLYYLQYLFIVIPGTIIGDKIYSWMKSRENIELKPGLTQINLFLLMIAFIVTNLVCLYSRLLILNLIINFLFIIFGFVLLRKSGNSFDMFIKDLFSHGSFWLLLGLFFEAFEGGIKKDHPTMSYYFVTTGLAVYSYVAFTVLIDYLGKKKIVNLLVESGQNPMIAYIAGSNVILPVLALTGLNYFLNLLLINPWLGFIKGLIFTLLVAILTSAFTKFKVFWRT
jgi:predicted acyltransferase